MRAVGWEHSHGPWWRPWEPLGGVFKENDLPAFHLLTYWSADRGPRRPAPTAGICPHPPPPALLAWPRYLTPTCPHGQWSLRGWEPDQRPLGPPQ